MTDPDVIRRRLQIANLNAGDALRNQRRAAPQSAWFAAIAAAGILVAVSACTTASAPAPYGTDTFVIQSTSRGGYSMWSQVHEAAHVKAADHCADLGKAMQPVSQTVSGVQGWSRQGVTLSLVYRCITTASR
jgi:hypothetical protein